MLEELQNNGPFVVSFETDVNFIYYKSGIYHSLDTKNKFFSLKSEWNKIDHSVLLVGFGEDEITKEKFWILQNTWGPNWGEGGFFRIKRGTNELGIESTCEIGIRVIIDNLNNEILIPKDNRYLPKSKLFFIEDLIKKNSINKYKPLTAKRKGLNKKML